jgi:hypothetical protein
MAEYKGVMIFCEPKEGKLASIATEMAEKVKKVADKLGLSTEIEFYENPRIEEEQVNYYNPIHEKLYQLGFRATHDLEEQLEIMLTDLSKYKHRLVAKKSRILPSVRWTGDNTGYELEGKKRGILFKLTRRMKVNGE